MNCRCDFASKQAVHRPSHAALAFTQSKAQFRGRTSVLLQRPVSAGSRQCRPAVVEVLDFKFMKKLGLKKPEFLPDFGRVRCIAFKHVLSKQVCLQCLLLVVPSCLHAAGTKLIMKLSSSNLYDMQDKRQAMLDRFFTSYDKPALEELLSDNAQIVEQGPKTRTYNKSEWINLLVNHVVPAVPDYNWCHATDATKDKDGYCIVKVKVLRSAKMYLLLLTHGMTSASK